MKVFEFAVHKKLSCSESRVMNPAFRVFSSGFGF